MKKVNKETEQSKNRILGRQVSQELSLEEMSEINGAGFQWPWCDSNPNRDDKLR